MITIYDKQPVMVFDYTKSYDEANKQVWLEKFGAVDIKMIGTHAEYFALAVYFNPGELDASTLAAGFGATLTVKFSESLAGVKAQNMQGTINRSLVKYMRIDD